MSTVASLLVFAGVLIVVLAAVGLVRLKTTYARIHAAGKASPVAFIVVAIGGSIELGGAGAARLVFAAAALMLTLPLAVHLLFRAVHVSQPEIDPDLDELRRDEG